MTGYQLDPQDLRRLEKGIRGAVDALKEHGFDVEASLGGGFSDMELSVLDVGNPALAEEFRQFCTEWGWAVRKLMQDVTDTAQALSLNAGAYAEQEQYVEDTLKSLVTAAQGNPYLSDDQVAGRSWKQTLGDNTYSHIRGADYSPASMRRGGAEALGAWEQAGVDAGASALVRDARSAGRDGGEG